MNRQERREMHRNDWGDEKRMLRGMGEPIDGLAKLEHRKTIDIAALLLDQGYEPVYRPVDEHDVLGF